MKNESFVCWFTNWIVNDITYITFFYIYITLNIMITPVHDMWDSSYWFKVEHTKDKVFYVFIRISNAYAYDSSKFKVQT